MECLALAYLLNSYQHDKEFNPIDKKSLLYLTCRLYHISGQEFDYNLYIRIKRTQCVFVDVICSNSSTSLASTATENYFPDKMQRSLTPERMQQNLLPDEMQ